MAVNRTVRQVIEASLRLVGAIAVGETPSAEDMSTGKIALQDLIAEWGDGGLVVPSYVKEAITLVIGQVSYQIGEIAPADLDTVRPEQIIGAFVKSGGYDYPVAIIGERAYRGFLNKTNSGRPNRLWYNAIAPLGVISTYPVASAADELWITSIKPFTEPTTLPESLLDTTEIPRNYHNALKWNLALELAPEYGKTADQVIIGRAQRTYDKIISLNAARRVQPSPIDVVTGSGHNNNDLIEV